MYDHNMAILGISPRRLACAAERPEVALIDRAQRLFLRPLSRVDRKTLKRCQIDANDSEQKSQTKTVRTSDTDSSESLRARHYMQHTFPAMTGDGFLALRTPHQ
jgi:hypothetical protein